MRIYGAGMAGLLAAQMLRRWSPVIWEAQSSLPNNHAALLRFRTEEVSRVTGIPFTRVTVHKAVKWKGNVLPVATLQHSNAYSGKVTDGRMISNRSLLNLDPVERYIAPDDFIGQLARGLQIEYTRPFLGKDDFDGPRLSTIPLPVMLQLLKIESPFDFEWQGIWTYKAIIGEPEVQLYQTIYYPGNEPFYRVSITGRQLMIEYIAQLQDGTPLIDTDTLSIIREDFGLGTLTTGGAFHFQRYGKLLPAPDDNARKELIWRITSEHGIYSLGRFATWRQLLLDDVVGDTRKIESFIMMNSNYSRALSRTGGNV